MGEARYVIGGVQRKKGMFKSEKCTLVVTDRGIVVAKLTRKMEKEWMRDRQRRLKEKYDEMRSSGKGRLVSTFGAMIDMLGLYDRYYLMSVDEILSEDSDNFVIMPSQISKISLKDVDAYNDDYEYNRAGTKFVIDVVWSGGKERFTYVGENLISKLKEFFEENYPGVDVRLSHR